jgi:hypothetical protein
LSFLRQNSVRVSFLSIFAIGSPDHHFALYMIFPIWGVPTRAQDLKCAHCRPPWLSRVVGDICRILFSTVNRSVCTLYWNKNINTFWKNVAFYYKIKSCALVETPYSIWRNVEVMKLYILLVSLLFYYFLSLRGK